MSFDRTDVEQIAFDTTGDEVFGLPSGTTAQRPASPSNGFMRHNTDENVIEAYINGEWVKLDSSEYPDLFQGETSGYAMGGRRDGNVNVIEKFSLTSDQNATDVGDLSSARYGSAGAGSTTHGYVAGGSTTSGEIDIIEKFSFSVDGNSTDVGDLTVTFRAASGHSSSTHGYASDQDTEINKYSYATDSNATDVGDLTASREASAGQSSETHGYKSGGISSNVIDKFSFVTDGNATDVGDLTQTRMPNGGQSSTTHGYTASGILGATSYNIIDKFSFSSDGNATDVGDLTSARFRVSGQSSTTHGYSSGGTNASFNAINNIDKFSFSVDDDLEVQRTGTVFFFVVFSDVDFSGIAHCETFVKQSMGLCLIPVARKNTETPFFS